MSRTKPVLTETTVFQILDERGTPDSWLARMMGVDRTTISRIRNRQRTIPSWFVEKAPLIFGIPAEILFPELADSESDRDTAVA